MSKSHQVTFGITAPPTIYRSVHSSRQNIDYLTLNAGFEDDEVSSPKHKRRTMYRPCSGLSATRQTAQKHTASSESKVVPKAGKTTALPAIPSSTVKTTLQDDLTGVPGTIDYQILPDLVLQQDDPDTTQAVSTEEQMDAAMALLSHGDIWDEMLDEDNENAELMPIGGQNVPVDIVPQPIRLDQISVDNAIVGMIQSKEQPTETQTNEQADNQPNQTNQTKPVAKLDDVPMPDEGPDTNTEDTNKTEPAMKGKLKARTYTLKKKTDTKR